MQQQYDTMSDLSKLKDNIKITSRVLDVDLMNHVQNIPANVKERARLSSAHMHNMLRRTCVRTLSSSQDSAELTFNAESGCLFYEYECAILDPIRSLATEQSPMDGISDVQKTPSNGAMLGPLATHTCAWVASETDWDSSASTSPDVDKDENDRLWDFFSKIEDPYNPTRFTSTLTTASNQSESLLAIPSATTTITGAKKSNLAQWAGGKVEMFLNPFSQTGNLHCTINPKTWLQDICTTTTRAAVTIVNAKQRNHPDRTLVVWERAKSTLSREESIKINTTHKTASSSSLFHVKFSPLVQIHVMRAWSFARKASRKGQWEEHARDRDRFRRRIVQAERIIGNCFTPSHREMMRRFLFDDHLEQTATIVIVSM
uniref:Protein phosphatase 1 regulatory subunit 15A/B C-terminal domain-containing protein n=1 Tax=Nothobranchius furzeri TaxID=105023 RepID=A0A8C6LR44_NOTFU